MRAGNLVHDLSLSASGFRNFLIHPSETGCPLDRPREEEGLSSERQTVASQSGAVGLAAVIAEASRWRPVLREIEQPFRADARRCRLQPDLRALSEASGQGGSR
jgi:hypothetical protein